MISQIELLKASIGFSLPITQMFRASVVWRSIIYAILMMLGKLICGIWLVRVTSSSHSLAQLTRIRGRAANSSPPASETIDWESKTVDHLAVASTQTQAGTHSEDTTSATAESVSPSAPHSLYPAVMLGSAMVARGEIGFLISSVAESTGIFSEATRQEDSVSAVFLVVTWAILLCTVVGPLTVGLLVRRVRMLQSEERSRRTGRGKPLGIWGPSYSTHAE